MESQTDMCAGARRPVHSGRVAVGSIVLVTGLVTLADRNGWVDLNLWDGFPGFVLIALGLAQAAETWFTHDRDGRDPLHGLGSILVGLWLLGTAFHIFGMTYRTSWPLLVVVVGVLMVSRELLPKRPASREKK